MTKQLYKFNPSLLSPQVLQKTLVGREKELFRILRKIEECAQGASLRHFLIIGPRGIGKTHLILLIYYTIKGDIAWNHKSKDLNHFWIPIRLAEEEYRITTLGELLARILQEFEESSDSVEGLSTVSYKSDRPFRQAETEELLDIFVRNREQLGRRFLLLIDNFHEILERFSEEDQGRLRDILMSKDLFLLIGAAPTLFERITSYKEPFYNFFENIWLRELDADEGANLIYKWSEQESEHDFLEHFEEVRPRINALTHLAGGNPRMIVSLYSIFIGPGIIEVESTFTALLDEFTPYFQLRMKELSPQQAKILDTMASMEGPSSPTHIAKEVRLGTTKVTSQLKRMQTSGYVRLLRERGRRTVLYDVSDYLFRLWRQMRVETGKQYLRFLVTVIKIWYTQEELEAQFDKVTSDLHSALDESNRERAEQSLKHLWYLREASPSYLNSKISSERLEALMQLADFQAAETEIQRLLAEGKEKRDEHILAMGYWYKARLLAQSGGEIEEQLEAIKAHLELNADSGYGWYNLGVCYLELEHYQEAVVAFHRAIEIDPEMPEAWYNIGNGYLHSERYEKAIEAYRMAIETKPDFYQPLCNTGGAYFELEHYQETIEFCRKAIEVDSNRYEAWGLLGQAYFRTQDYDRAVEALQRVVEIEPNSYEVWGHLAAALVFSGHNQEAIEICRKALEARPDEPNLWATLGHAFSHLESYQEALKATTKAVDLDPSSPVYHSNRGHAYERMGRLTSAIRDFEEALKLAQEAHEEDLVEYTAIRLLDLNLLCSAKRVIPGKMELAEKYLKKSLTYAQLVPPEKFEESMIAYLSDLLRKKKTGFLMRVLKIVEQAKLPNLEELLRFYRISLQYLETKDRAILNQLFPELRELVEGLDQ